MGSCFSGATSLGGCAGKQSRRTTGGVQNKVKQPTDQSCFSGACGCCCGMQNKVEKHLVKVSEPDLHNCLDGWMMLDELRDAPHQIQLTAVDEIVRDAKAIVSHAIPVVFGMAGSAKSSLVNALYLAVDPEAKPPAATDANEDCTTTVEFHKAEKACDNIAGQDVYLVIGDTPGWIIDKKPENLVPKLKDLVQKTPCMVPEVFNSSIKFVFVMDVTSAATRRQLESEFVEKMILQTCSMFRSEQAKVRVFTNITMVLVAPFLDKFDDEAEEGLLRIERRIKGFVEPLQYVTVKGTVRVCTKPGQFRNIDKLMTLFRESFVQQMESPEVRLVLFRTMESAIVRFLEKQLREHPGVMDEGSAARRATWALARNVGLQVKHIGELFPKMRLSDVHKVCTAMRRVMLQELVSQPEVEPPLKMHTDALRVDFNWRRGGAEAKDAEGEIPDALREVFSRIRSGAEAAEAKATEAKALVPEGAEVEKRSPEVPRDGDAAGAEAEGPTSPSIVDPQPPQVSSPAAKFSESAGAPSQGASKVEGEEVLLSLTQGSVVEGVPPPVPPPAPKPWTEPEAPGPKEPPPASKQQSEPVLSLEEIQQQKIKEDKKRQRELERAQSKQLLREKRSSNKDPVSNSSESVGPIV